MRMIFITTQLDFEMMDLTVDSAQDVLRHVKRRHHRDIYE